MLAITAAYMLVQLSSLPVALALPSLATYFGTSIDDAAWVIVVYLLMLGSTVLLAARLGDRYGHSRVFFVGILASTLGSSLIAVSQELWQIVLWRALTGLGSALIMGNANAILAATFPPEQRGRAFAIPIMGSRFGTLIGLALFGAFLHFFSWRPVFATFVPLGLVCVLAALPLLRYRHQPTSEDAGGSIDWLGGVILAATAVVLILSGSHLHGGEESYVSPDGLSYHLPMHLLFLVMLACFVVVELKVGNPIVAMRHFREKPFSLSLGSNVIYHFSMLSTMTLIPILVEEGFGKSPLYVTVVLLPSQTLGLFMPMVAGWVYDRYQPNLLRPGTMAIIAGGFLVLGLSSVHVSFWALPLLMLPISIGTNMFNPINNATVMNSLPLEHRGVASGMLETTRELGHAIGATAAASALALALPSAVELLSDESSRIFFREAFQTASLMVVVTLLVGAALAYFHKSRPVSTPAPQPSRAD